VKPIIDEEQVRRIARLARLHVRDEQVPRLTAQLAQILQYMQQLDEVDTTGVSPLSHPLPVTNVLRDDEPGTPMPVAAALASAPAREGDFFLVPPVLKPPPSA
jgi:aspartyl-tRNA(Asn)/glutamyl-tRNA(Gln) amidotransferase subunit C